MMMRDNGTRKHFPPQEKTSLRHQTAATSGKKTVINPSPEAPGVRAGTPVGQASWGVAFSFPCQEFTITLKNKKKSRAESLKSQRHPALEDKFDHCIT
ncbi:hypothetical protein [Akkermansia muciniphila]|uniref:hypothetical protein n=1 Tax=Akkermansia muciniphila TaxID=239935 RepID=UPI000B8EA200|nr:hypothetical protein [Akkermansia muciniphila]